MYNVFVVIITLPVCDVPVFVHSISKQKWLMFLPF